MNGGRREEERGVRGWERGRGAEGRANFGTWVLTVYVGDVVP